MFIHLTNYSLNKENTSFRQATSVEDENSHKRTITSLLKRLREDGKDVDSMKDQINDIVIKTMISIEPELVHSYRTS
jgi:tubulin polyglutamylase TTLL6/13